MKVSKMLAVASVTGVLAATAIASPAFAWHPKGTIKKSVQNQTTGSALSDANGASAAVAAKPGDVLKYVIVVSNTGDTASNNSNDMYYTKLTDTLPAGVELVSDPSKKAISEDLGTVKPGQNVTKEYLVKVTSTKDGDVIENKACFTGDSQVKDNPQQGCDVADVKVTVPKTPEQPKTPETPKAPETPAPTPQPAATPAPEALPSTGASEFFAPVAALTSAGAAYAGRMMVIKRRQK
jgi:uncharacterized repeat protein (TIGR01451 family)